MTFVFHASTKSSTCCNIIKNNNNKNKKRKIQPIFKTKDRAQPSDVFTINKYNNVIIFNNKIIYKILYI